MSEASRKIDRLVLAGRLAPALRRASARRVKVYDRKRFDETGELVVRDETTVGVVQEAAAKAAELEVDVLHPEEWCGNYPKCRKRAPMSALAPGRLARRSGRAWLCGACRKKPTVRCSRCGSTEISRTTAAKWRSGTPGLCGDCRSVGAAKCSFDGCERKLGAKASYAVRAGRKQYCASHRGGLRTIESRERSQQCCAGTNHKPCNRKPPADAFTPAVVARRGGAPWRCIRCTHALRRAPTITCATCGGKVSHGSACKARRLGVHVHCRQHAREARASRASEEELRV